MEGSNRSGRGGRWIRTRMVARGRKKKPGSSTAAVAEGGVNVVINRTGVDAMARPRANPPKQNGVWATRRWPPNCGPRRGVEDGGGGGKLQAAADGEPLLEEEEEEPEECDCCGFRDGEKDDANGGQSRTVDGGEGVQVRVLLFYWNSMTLSWKFDE
ncbi:unnamed protein product [Linum trigynum]|uniref:Uncharacterized protein n=1 Tax=Linum trigynum TaxID=586398 RepID=A0AAV2G7K8_9ROSI